MEFLNAYIVPVIVGICLIMGYCIKKFVKNDRLDDFIPTFACALGTVIAVWNSGAINPDILLMGMASGLASTGLYEMVTHWVEQWPKGEHVKESE